ncbi:MAG: hypothetical protein NZ921_03195 [Candidatus Caldarchaeum sp.]|nr:hypothetical protein [Candidatus Caldarchaeum sp.]
MEKVARRGGWVYVWVTEVRKDGDVWLFRIETLLRKAVSIASEV